MLIKSNLTVFESLIAGIFFSFVISWKYSVHALPLINLYPDFFLNIVLPVLVAISVILIFFKKKYLRSFFVLAFISLLIVTIFRYSSGYAFRSFVLFVLLFPVIFFETNTEKAEKEKEVCGALVLFLLFIFAGIQKINSVYLSGAEFISGGPFLAFIDLWFPGKLPRVFNSDLSWLPYLSIMIELIIGAGILFRPKIFSHLAAFFMLLISFINPMVLNVYFFLLPFLILIDQNIRNLLETSSFKRLLKSPVSWAFIISIFCVPFETFEAALYRNYLFIIILILTHIYVLVTSRHKCEKSIIELGGKIGIRAFIIPALMTIFFVSSFIFLPAPFGFKMFSGQRFQLDHYDLKIMGQQACRESLKRWAMVPVTDAAIILEGENCHLLFPTIGGIKYAAQHLCRSNNNMNFILKKSDENKETTISCTELNN